MTGCENAETPQNMDDSTIISWNFIGLFCANKKPFTIHARNSKFDENVKSQCCSGKGSFGLYARE